MAWRSWGGELALGVLVAGVVAANLWAGTMAVDQDARGEDEDAVPVEVVSADAGEVVLREKVPGVTSSREAVAVLSPLAGRVESVSVEFGDQVQSGQELARLEAGELESRVRQARAGVDAVEAQLEGVQAGPGAGQLAQLEASVRQAQAGVAGARLGVQAAEQGYSQVHQQLGQARGQLEQARVTRLQAQEALRQMQEGTPAQQADLGVRQARRQHQAAQEQAEQLQEALEIIEDRIEDLQQGSREIPVRASGNEGEPEAEETENNDGPDPENGLPPEETEEQPPGENGIPVPPPLEWPEFSWPELEAPDLEDLVPPEWEEELREQMLQSLEAEKRSLETQLLLAEAERDLARLALEGAEITREQVVTEAVREAELGLEQAQAAEEAAREQLRMLEQTAARQIDWARVDQSQALGALAQAEAALREGLAGARAHEVDMARAQVREANSALETAQSQLGERVVVAPISGQVTELTAQSGQMAGPEVPLARIVNPDALKVELKLTDRMIGAVAPGDPVQVIFPTRDEMARPGTVAAVAQAADPETAAFAGEVSLENPGDLRAGELVEVELTTRRSGTRPVIPLGAVLEDQEGEYVMVLEQGVARKRRVQTGIDDGEKVAIEQGLQHGEDVIIRGQHYAGEGQKVRVEAWNRGDGS